MRIFIDFDVYERKYTYDEMKVMSVLCSDDYKSDTDGLDYEDLMIIANAVYNHWLNFEQIFTTGIYYTYPWMMIMGFEEKGYIQKYADRVMLDFIKLYNKETTK